MIKPARSSCQAVAVIELAVIELVVIELAFVDL
jgi:hypothetical protein